MVWYADGSIEVATNGQAAIGTGTAFLKNVRIGDGLTIAGSASMHEVTNIASDTQLSFSPPYTGAAGAGKQYRIAPIQGYVKEAADLLRALTQRLGEFANNANLQSFAALQGRPGQVPRFTGPGQLDSVSLDGFQSTGQPLKGKALVECLSFSDSGVVPDILIKTKIPASEIVMPSLVIEGAINGYTVPFRIDLSWYFYQGAVYLPTVVTLSGSGLLNWVNVYLSVESGLINVRLQFLGGSVYLPRISIRAIRTGDYGGALSYYEGWSYQAASGARPGEVLADARRVLKVTDIEQGSNANGSWTKYPDGTLEVWKNFGVACAANTLKQVYVDLPTAISFDREITPSLTLGAPTDTWGFECKQLAAVMQGSTSVMISMMCTVTQQYTVFLRIAGRWK